jgi:hypothetical protein
MRPSQLPKKELQPAIPHVPALQLGVPFGAAQGTPVPQVPVPVHVCTDVPEQRLAPGMQATHTLVRQAAEAQSPLAAQLWPSAQSAAQPPPQSASASVPFFTPSLHAAAAQAFPVHLPLAGSTQSTSALQLCPTVQLAAQLPPQSMSVSVPFFTPSPHAAAAQAKLVHLPLSGSAQSRSTKHAWPTGHGLHVPPQSTAVSLPFFTLSLHWASMQLPVASSHW